MAAAASRLHSTLLLPPPPPASAFVSYAGPFTSRFRSGLISDWIKFLTDKGVPMTEGIKGEGPIAPSQAQRRTATRCNARNTRGLGLAKL